MNTKNNLRNFDTKTDKEIFLGYATSSKSYRFFNKRTLVVEESMHIVFYEINPFKPRKVIVIVVDDDVGALDELN